MKYIVALIFSILVSAKDFGNGFVANIFSNLVSLGHSLQHSPADTIATIAGGMLPIILIWFGVTWLIKKFKSQQSTPLAQTSTNQAPQPAPPAYTPNANTQHPAIAKAVMPPTQLTTPSLITAVRSTQVSADDNLWEQALNEYDGSARKQGLWARLFSEAQGNEAIVKANYLRIRVEEIKQLIFIKSEHIQLTRNEVHAKQSLTVETSTSQENKNTAQPKGICSHCKIPIMSPNNIFCSKCRKMFNSLQSI